VEEAKRPAVGIVGFSPHVVAVIIVRELPAHPRAVEITALTQYSPQRLCGRMSAHSRIRHPFCGTSIVPFDAHGLGRPTLPLPRAIDGTF
jgi:hypothetical protein